MINPADTCECTECTVRRCTASATTYGKLCALMCWGLLWVSYHKRMMEILGQVRSGGQMNDP